MKSVKILSSSRILWFYKIGRKSISKLSICNFIVEISADHCLDEQNSQNSVSAVDFKSFPGLWLQGVLKQEVDESSEVEVQSPDCVHKEIWK